MFMKPRRMLPSLAAHSPDPTKAFYQFAAQMRFDKKVKGLSLGQGQGLKATSLIEEASQKGTWVSKETRNPWHDNCVPCCVFCDVHMYVFVNRHAEYPLCEKRSDVSGFGPGRWHGASKNHQNHRLGESIYRKYPHCRSRHMHVPLARHTWSKLSSNYPCGGNHTR